MSRFNEKAYEAGFSDPMEYMDYLEGLANEFDGFDDGCGEGYSCDECDNYGCPSHPCN